jgi:hypothetical protein
MFLGSVLPHFAAILWRHADKEHKRDIRFLWHDRALDTCPVILPTSLRKAEVKKFFKSLR